jgi:hypothetical protein
MKKTVMTALVAASCGFIAGCAKYYYNPAPQILPQYIHKMAIRPFANHTQQFRIEDKLTLAVQSLINQDGRYAITTEDQADGVLIGDITKYILEPLQYDANNIPSQYKLWILVNVSFYDKVRNQTLWTEPNLGNPVIFYSASSGRPGALTEDEAQQEIWNQLSVDITTRTLEGFGTVTGSSEKAVPQVSPDQYPTVPAQEPGIPTTPPAITPGIGTNRPPD